MFEKYESYDDEVEVEEKGKTLMYIQQDKINIIINRKQNSVCNKQFEILLN